MTAASPSNHDTPSFVAAPTKTVHVDGAALAYREIGSGTGRPLVALVHLGGNLDAWDPEVIDALVDHRELVSSNYYPDWSRTTFLDIRNVEGLRLDGIALQSHEPDARPPYLIEGCTVLREDVTVLPPA